ncbi:hypothetical protein KY345_00150 [Candidatus Woesearchaeota archaeon]|nr:hypothetical protein [Candidatus Woesearchaeota archaeon]
MILLLLTGIVNAASTLTNCYVSAIDGTCGADTAIFSISGQTNAHGAVNTTKAGYARVCCQGSEINNSYVGGARTATVVLLNQTTNAHAQDPSIGTYNYPVYISTENSSYNITCIYDTDGCDVNYTAVISLEQSTNSQIGNATAYSNQICCKIEEAAVCAGTDNDNDTYSTSAADAGKLCCVGNTQNCSVGFDCCERKDWSWGFNS